MSINAEALLAAATKAVEAVIADVRNTAPDDPAILHRVGKLDTALAASRAAARRGQGEAAGLLASTVLRDVARDFPAQAGKPADLLAEDLTRRSLALQALEDAA